jgi:hypothetical protein
MLTILEFKNINNDQVNYLNIFLMLFSLVLAAFYPFELFLVSFIIIGPLHYLTEISWLEKKQFFVPKQSNVVLLILVILAFGLFLIFPNKIFNDFINTLLFSTLVYALMVVLTSNFLVQILTFLGSFLLVFIAKWHEQDWFLIVFSVFLPTIFHITIFTGLFILSGIMKNKSLSGWLSFACFLCCTVAFFVLPFVNIGYEVMPIARELYGDYIVLNKKFSDFFHFGQINKLEDIFQTREGIAIMQFIAFSYTYHYLNWFTKTSIIKWHEIPKMRMLGLAVAYVAVLGIYFYNKMVGVGLLSVLGIAHIILEFPLNGLALKSIFKR